MPLVVKRYGIRCRPLVHETLRHKEELMQENATKVVNFQSSALDLTRYNLRVHPLKENSKEPLLKSYPKLATTDDLIIDDWGHQHPHANIGIVTGIESGVFVLDIDRRRDGDICLAGIEAKYGKLTPTWTVQSSFAALLVEEASFGGAVGVSTRATSVTFFEAVSGFSGAGFIVSLPKLGEVAGASSPAGLPAIVAGRRSESSGVAASGS